MKKVFLFSTFMFFSLVLTGCGNQTGQNVNSPKTGAYYEIKAVKADKIEVVDFHGTRRCYSCQIVEQYTRETLEENFKEEMAEGKIIFLSINGELSENQETVIKYQARGSSLFINAITNGKDNISEDTMVWRLVGDEQKFKTYLKEKINKLLNGD